MPAGSPIAMRFGSTPVFGGGLDNFQFDVTWGKTSPALRGPSVRGRRRPHTYYGKIRGAHPVEIRRRAHRRTSAKIRPIVYCRSLPLGAPVVLQIRRVPE